MIPFAVVLALLLGTTVAYQLQQADQSDPAFLSSASSADIGGSRLARMLTAQGISIERVERTSDALVSAYRGDATLFVPAPSLVHPYYLRMLKLLPATTRVVLVAPEGGDLANGRLPFGAVDQRLASAVAEPGCGLSAAVTAGPAAALRIRYDRVGALYARERHRCYDDGLVVARWYRTELVAVGANDPFRNDRIDEHGNAALATGLLGERRRLVWLDLHEREPRPGYDPNGTLPGAPPSLGPGSPDPDFPIPSDAPDGPNDDGGDDGLDGDGDGAQGGDAANPLWGAFPPGLWALLALLLVAGLLLALARGRRLAAPVAEPLPVTVPAAETVRGRGRLYQRARARTEALATLRTATRARLARQLDLPDGTDDAVLAEAVAARTGVAARDVLAVLVDPIGGTDAADRGGSPDDELVRLATSLHALTNLVEAASPPRVANEGDVR